MDNARDDKNEEGYTAVLQLETPHGFLMAQEKQTAIARPEPLDTDQRYLIVSGGEAFGVATLEQAAQMKAKEFDGEEWVEQHRVTPRERRQWWGDADNFFVHRLKLWEPYEGVKLFEDGQVIDEPRLTSDQWKLVSAAKELPKVITLIDDAVSVTDRAEFIINNAAQCDDLRKTLEATYQMDVKPADGFDEYIPIYSLALVRNPRMRVSKKNLSPEGAEKQAEIEIEIEEPEGDDMPYRIRERDGEYCVVKINPDDSDGETEGCHETREEAEAQLTALNINVVAEEGEMGMDKPKKRKPRKKESEPLPEEKDTFLTRLKLAAKNIIDIITLAEKETEDNKLFMSEVGIGQKIVNGELWHFTYSTNAFEDREGEIFSTKSLENYVTSNEANEDKGYFNLWHINAEDGGFSTDFAKKEWQGVMGRFLVEAGPYLQDEKGKAAKKFFGEHTGGHPDIAPEGWGCSPEFRYLPEERATGTYENIWITRTSTLPKFAAANVWTETRQLRGNKMALSDQQKQAAVEIFGNDFVSQMIQEAEQKTTDLETAGVAHKDKKEAQPEPIPKQQNMEATIDMAELAAEVGKQFSANLAPMAEAIEAMAGELKALQDWKAGVEKERGIKEQAEAPRFVFEWKRASEDEKTMVSDDDNLKDQKPAETKAAKDGDAWAALFK